MTSFKRTSLSEPPHHLTWLSHYLHFSQQGLGPGRMVLGGGPGLTVLGGGPGWTVFGGGPGWTVFGGGPGWTVFGGCPGRTVFGGGAGLKGAVPGHCVGGYCVEGGPSCVDGGRCVDSGGPGLCRDSKPGDATPRCVDGGGPGFQDAVRWDGSEIPCNLGKMRCGRWVFYLQNIILIVTNNKSILYHIISIPRFPLWKSRIYNVVLCLAQFQLSLTRHILFFWGGGCWL